MNSWERLKVEGVPWRKITSNCQSIGVVRLFWGSQCWTCRQSAILFQNKHIALSNCLTKAGLDRFLHPPWRRSIWQQQHKLQWTSTRLINRADFENNNMQKLRANLREFIFSMRQTTWSFAEDAGEPHLDWVCIYTYTILCVYMNIIYKCTNPPTPWSPRREGRLCLADKQMLTGWVWALRS